MVSSAGDRSAQREDARRGARNLRVKAPRIRFLAFDTKTRPYGAAARSDTVPQASENDAQARRRSGSQNSDGCGGARAANAERGRCSSSRRSRCARMRLMSAGSSMLAITSSRPPQRRQRSMSIANTRFSLRAQLMATYGASGGRSAPASLSRAAPCPRPAGVIAARSAACGARFAA
jgi:hypothetical protein